ncbi:hypothetical protein HZ326_2312 [Fusarium oxysporum f. sp. albedinis]|nr:hypothetical protein HZ326_2312 [Fusarium oxysporum f. sp. albedinis]
MRSGLRQTGVRDIKAICRLVWSHDGLRLSNGMSHFLRFLRFRTWLTSVDLKKISESISLMESIMPCHIIKAQEVCMCK